MVDPARFCRSTVSDWCSPMYKAGVSWELLHEEAAAIKGRKGED